MRQGSHSSALTHSHQETATQSGLLEQLMSYDNGLQVASCCCVPPHVLTAAPPLCLCACDGLLHFQTQVEKVILDA